MFWRRQVAVLRRMGKTEDAVNELRSLLDTFCNDLEGWLELADIYSSCCQYVLALLELALVFISFGCQVISKLCKLFHMLSS